jgi:AcrR family transcriptional regulator
VIAAAQEVLAVTGDAHAVSIRAVAERIGVTSPSIYIHFKDKSELLDAVCARVFADLDRALSDADASVDAPLERLVAEGKAYVRFALARPEQYRLATMVPGERAGRTDEVLSDTAFRRMLACVDDCVAAGVFPPPPEGVPVLGLQLWTSVHGIAALLICKPWLPWGDTDQLIDRALRAVANGYALPLTATGQPKRAGRAKGTKANTKEEQ